MQLSKIQIILIGAGLLIITLIALLFTGVIPGLRTNEAAIKGELTVWGVFAPETTVINTLVADFQKKNPQVRINYVEKNSGTYEADLINALAAGTGPDIFFFKNSWLPKHGNKILPLDPKKYPVQKLAEDFPDVVSADFASGGKVYALPLYIDTLALYYNKTIFDNAGIAEPPKDWAQFVEFNRRLTKFDSTGRITRAGAAIGSGSRSINESTDLLSLIMLQFSTPMVTENLSAADFGQNGLKGITFYTNFANPRVGMQYTWDPSLHYSLDAFAEENVAMIFNYAYQLPRLKEKNPFLNIGIAPMMQLPKTERAVNYANYWGLAVSKKSQFADLSTQFMLDSTTDPATNGKFLNAAIRPPALRSLINRNLNDATFGIFVRQALTAKSWPQIDSTAVDRIFTQMLDLINAGRLPAATATEQAETQLTALIQRRGE